MQLLAAYRQSFSNLSTKVWILATSMLINRSGSMVLLFASLYFTNDLHYTIAQAGFVMSFYGIGSIIGSYIGGWLADRKNLKDIMIISLASSGIILQLLLVVKTPTLVAAVIMLYALTSDAFRPANSKAISIYSDAANLTRSVSLVRLAVNLGFTIGPAIGGFIALYLGYKLLFVIDGLTSIGAALLLWFYLPHKSARTLQHADSPLHDNSTSAYRDVVYLAFIFLVALYAIIFFQLFASIPQYFHKVCHYNEDTIGLLLALNGFLVVLIEMPVVAALERNKKIFAFIIGGTLCLPVAFVTLMFGHGLILMAVVYTCFMTFSEILAMPFMMNYTLSKSRAERRGQYAALYSIAYGIANIVAPALGLGLADRYGFTIMFVWLIIIATGTAIGFYFLGLYTKRQLTKPELVI